MISGAASLETPLTHKMAAFGYKLLLLLLILGLAAKNAPARPTTYRVKITPNTT